MLKTIFSSLVFSALLFFIACKRTPETCLYPSNIKTVDTISLNTTLNFDAGCTRFGNKFQWYVIHNTNLPDSNQSQSDSKYFTHKFEQLGPTQIRVVASNRSGKKTSLQRYYYIKP